MWIFLSLDQINEIKSRISTDITRPRLGGVHIDLDSNRVFVADGHRMAVREFTNEPAYKVPFDQVIPQGEPLACARINALDFIRKLKKRTNKEDVVNLSFSQYVLDVRTIDGCVTLKLETNNIDTEPIGDGCVPVSAPYLLEALTVLVKKMKVASVVISYYGREHPVVLSLGSYPDDPNFEIVMPCT